jgi:hypothetical protein
VQLPANFCRGAQFPTSQPQAQRRASRRVSMPFSHAAAGVGRSKPTNAARSAATAFSACRPEDAKSYPNKMFELSGFRDATTAGNCVTEIFWNPLHRALTCRNGRAPKDERLLETP